MRAKGLGLCVLGMGLLGIPLFAGQSPLLLAYASALRPAGWFAAAAGVVLLVLHHVRNARRAPVKTSPPAQQPAPHAIDAATPPLPSAPAGAPTLREIRDELKKKAGTPDQDAKRR
jgi:hypothetical protein